MEKIAFTVILLTFLIYSQDAIGQKKLGTDSSNHVIRKMDSVYYHANKTIDSIGNVTIENKDINHLIYNIDKKYTLPVLFIPPPPKLHSQFQKFENLSIDTNVLHGDSLKNRIYTESQERIEKETEELGRQFLAPADSEFREIQRTMEEVSELDQARVNQRVQSLTSMAKQQITKLLENNEIDTRKISSGMDDLKRKYDYVPNSNDLTTARKRTSLEDKPIISRITFNWNFTISNLDPVELFFNPGLGYRFNELFEIGLSANFELSDNSINGEFYSLGGGGYLRHIVFNNIFVQGEYNHVVAQYVESKNTDRRNMALLGLGYEINISHYIHFQTMVMYNMSHDNANELSKGPLIIRTGFRVLNINSRKTK